MYKKIKCTRKCTPRKTLNQAYINTRKPCTKKCSWYKHDKIRVSDNYEDMYKYAHSPKPTWYVWRERDNLIWTGKKNIFLSGDNPCHENMHGTYIWNKKKGCAWYSNGKKISEDPDYQHDDKMYVWKRK